MSEFVLHDAGIGIDTVFDLHDCGEGPETGYERRATVEAVRLFLQEAERRGWQSFAFPPGF